MRARKGEVNIKLLKGMLEIRYTSRQFTINKSVQKRAINRISVIDDQLSHHFA